MTKYLLLISVILIVIYVESSWINPTKSSNGRFKITFEYGGVDEVGKCDDECKGNCNNTCGADARCRFNCYVEECRCPGKAKKVSRDGLLGCTTKCREYCNSTCGEDLKCREQCYVKTCQCPPPEIEDDSEESVENDDDSNEDEVYQIRRRLMPQKPQCCPVCMSKCIHRCDKSKDKCAKYCKSKCCHDPSHVFVPFKNLNISLD